MRPSGQLNEAQKRRLYISCQYIDKLLGEIENILHEAASKSPFPRHVVDVTPAQARVLDDHIRRLREQLLRAIAWQDLRPEPPDIPATRAILTHLAFIDIAIEELKPSYMRGSGAVPEDAAEELNGIVHELRSVALGMDRYIHQEFGANLESRLSELEQSGHDVGLLRTIEEVVTRQGLVEFRSRIASFASRLEDNHLEVAVFGRVNSGKSSLLNALLGTDVLPVGVNPITAVPTKLRYGATLRAFVAFASGRDESASVEEFRSLVTELGNPGNQRNVVRAIVEVPSARLEQGIVLVDTPGLGSLARRGAAETLAYLPSCDLALLLIDAGAALNDEDIGTLRLLYEAGIPALVLLSKADLLREEDLARVASYIRDQVKQELAIPLNVHPVSAIPQFEGLLDRFFERELLPRFARSRELREASVARKIGALRESVAAALETSLEHERRGKETLPAENAAAIEERLRRVSGEIGEQHTVLDRAFFELAERPETILQKVGDVATERIISGQLRSIPLGDLTLWTCDAVQASVDSHITRTRSATRSAVDALQTTGTEMGRSAAPSLEEAEALVRDVPRFELGEVTGEIRLAPWIWLGRGAVRSAVMRKLHGDFQALLKDKLHGYRQVLSLWNDQMARRLTAYISSYADAYRAQLNRVRGGHAENVPTDVIERDLALLLDSSDVRSRNKGRKTA